MKKPYQTPKQRVHDITCAAPLLAGSPGEIPTGGRGPWDTSGLRFAADTFGNNEE